MQYHPQSYNVGLSGLIFFACVRVPLGREVSGKFYYFLFLSLSLSVCLVFSLTGAAHARNSEESSYIYSIPRTCPPVGSFFFLPFKKKNVF